MRFLSAFTFEKLMHPWALALIGIAVLVLALECTRGAPGAISISTGQSIARISHTLWARRRSMLRHAPPVLRAVGLSLLIVALARPLQGLRPRLERADVVDIMLCLDVSGSMRAMDFVAAGEPKDRLSVAKEAVRDFIRSRKLRTDDRFGIDRLGLILYAGYAWTQCPLTLDYGVLERELDAAYIDETNPLKNGTAIGSAIGLAVSKLADSEAQSKVAILLTDGRNNRGELDPLTAARIANEYGIRLYTIGAGAGGEVLIPRPGLFGERMVTANIPIDEDMLQHIAEMTGGRYYRAADTESLKQAYEEINQLEATEIEIGESYDYHEGFVPWVIAGALSLLASLFTRRIWFEPIP